MVLIYVQFAPQMLKFQLLFNDPKQTNNSIVHWNREMKVTFFIFQEAVDM